MKRQSAFDSADGFELGLYQAQVAEVIGVDECTVTNWEKNRMNPTLRTLPRIIGFLGCCPRVLDGTTFGEKIKAYREIRGVSQKQMAKLLDIDPSTLARWERGEGKPPVHLLALVKHEKE
jgi:transcriptional regulator with XRE-family HTH domain